MLLQLIRKEDLLHFHPHPRPRMSAICHDRRKVQFFGRFKYARHFAPTTEDSKPLNQSPRGLF
jgi:hypothetical protein